VVGACGEAGRGCGGDAAGGLGGRWVARWHADAGSLPGRCVRAASGLRLGCCWAGVAPGPREWAASALWWARARAAPRGGAGRDAELVVGLVARGCSLMARRWARERCLRDAGLLLSVGKAASGPEGAAVGALRGGGGGGGGVRGAGGDLAGGLAARKHGHLLAPTALAARCYRAALGAAGAPGAGGGRREGAVVGAASRGAAAWLWCASAAAGWVADSGCSLAAGALARWQGGAC